MHAIPGQKKNRRSGKAFHCDFRATKLHTIEVSSKKKKFLRERNSIATFPGAKKKKVVQASECRQGLEIPRGKTVIEINRIRMKKEKKTRRCIEVNRSICATLCTSGLDGHCKL